MATKSSVVPLLLLGPAPPLSGLQAEVTGMVETNVLDNQLPTGQVEML